MGILSKPTYALYSNSFLLAQTSTVLSWRTSRRSAACAVRIKLLPQKGIHTAFLLHFFYIMSSKNLFFQSPENQPHPARCKAMIQKYPQIQTLIGNNPYTFGILLFVVGLQFSLAWYVGTLGSSYWWATVLLAYFIGAFANHSLFVIIHDATHNLIFRNTTLNRLTAIIADLPNVVPSAMGFRIYHLKHHAHQGDHNYDADLASHWEARLVGNSALGKALWLLFFPVFQLLRPPRLKAIKLWSAWTVANLLIVLISDAAIIYFWGSSAFLYLVLSFMFSVGLHPVGARWIQEHYTTDGKQETGSYYGSLNILAMNVGYHNEHHDFPSIPWNRLPQLRSIAPDYYNNLHYYTSWTRLLLQFIFNPQYSLYSRVERIQDGKVNFKQNTAS